MRIQWLLAWLVAVSCNAATAQAQTQPRWELGIGAGWLDFPDYRGSDERQTLTLPLPYFNYRGDRLRVGRGGVRGLLLEREAVELDLSMNATPPVNSHDNQARAGMEDLDPTVEFGPSLRLKLAADAKRRWSTELRLPLRASIATDLTHAHYAGLVFQPHLALDFHGNTGWRLGVTAGAVFADRRQHEYFYGVPAASATVGRPAYAGRGGYGGVYVLGALRRRLDRWWIAGFVRVDDLRGAAFEDSPLFRTQHAFYAGIAFAWIFKESKEGVEIDDD